MQRYAQRTMNGFYCDCNESRDAWHMFFRTIQVISHKIGTKSDRIRLTLNFDEEVGFSLGLSHPALHRHAPLLWGFPTRCSQSDLLWTRVHLMRQAGVPGRLGAWFLDALNEYVGMEWSSSEVQNPRAKISKVMGIIGSPWLDDILVVLIDRLNDSLPVERKLPSLLE